jgi:ribosomal protein L14
MPPPPPPPPPPQVAHAGEAAKSVIKRTARERAKRDAGAFIFFTSNEANSWVYTSGDMRKTITFLT